MRFVELERVSPVPSCYAAVHLAICRQHLFSQLALTWPCLIYCECHSKVGQVVFVPAVFI